MLKIRVIPCLLLKNKGLVKTVKFKSPTYIGDPINAVKIFSDKEVPELILLDIEATKSNKGICFDLIKNIAEECYMPFGVGGGIKTVEDVKQILYNGAEKVIINTAAVENPQLIKELVEIFGGQSIVVSIDSKKNLFGKYRVFINSGEKATSLDPIKHAKHMESIGVGELIVNSIDNDGTMNGYDIKLIKDIAESVNIPVVALGGCGKLQDFSDAVKKGCASAVAAGSFFVYYGPRKAVLINYPTNEELNSLF